MLCICDEKYIACETAYCIKDANMEYNNKKFLFRFYKKLQFMIKNLDGDLGDCLNVTINKKQKFAKIAYKTKFCSLPERYGKHFIL